MLSLKYSQLQRRAWTRRLQLVLALCLVGLAVHVVIHDNWYRDPCQVLSEAPRATPELAPKVIHLQWRTEEALPTEGIQARALAAFRAHFAQHEIRIWTDAKMRALISERHADFLPYYDAYHENIQRVDAARYFILYEFGGLYADLDYVSFSDFWPLLAADRPSINESPFIYAERVQNSLMASPARHPFWLEVIAELKKRASSHNVVWSTGPNLVDDVIHDQGDPARVHILPCELFFRVPPARSKQGDVVARWMIANVYAHTWRIKNCGPFDEKDKCMLAAHFLTSTSAAKNFFYVEGRI